MHPSESTGQCYEPSESGFSPGGVMSVARDRDRAACLSSFRSSRNDMILQNGLAEERVAMAGPKGSPK